MGGWFFGFCFLLVYVFNLMICKVMFLFLFYTFQLIFNLCLENDSCNCTFFCLLTTRINDQFCVGGVYGAGYLSVRCHGMTGWPAHWAQTATEREARAHTGHTMALHTAASRTCAGPRRASFSLPRQTRMRSALSFQLPSGAKEEVCLRTCLGLGSAWRECGAASRCVRGGCPSLESFRALPAATANCPPGGGAGPAEPDGFPPSLLLCWCRCHRFLGREAVPLFLCPIPVLSLLDPSLQSWSPLLLAHSCGF